jgi:hypothetical protein
MMIGAFPASAGSLKIEGNFDLSGEARRDAHLQYNDLQGGYERVHFQNNRRNAWDLEFQNPRAEFRAWISPVAPIELYAKVFQANDFFLGEAHTKIRMTRGDWAQEKERGFESYFFYRQGRLGLGDPILGISYDQFGHGIATNWWLGRGEYTLGGGKWSGEFNIQNFPDETNASGEDNEAWTAKLRHDYRVNTDLNFTQELYIATKIFTDVGRPRQHNEIHGGSLSGTWKTTTLSMEYLESEAPLQGLAVSDNDVIGFDLRNLVLLDRDWTGRVGVNANFVKWGRNYTNWLGRNPDWITVGQEVRNNSDTTIGDNVRKDFYSELYWDLPRYQATLLLRHQDRDGFRRYRNVRMSRRNEAELYVKLVKGFNFNALYSRTNWGTTQFMHDYDADRLLDFTDRITNDLYFSLKMSRLWGHVKGDYRHYDQRDNIFDVAGLEASYRITERIRLLGRVAQVWIDRPWINSSVVTRPSDIGGGRTSLVEPFGRRRSVFAQISYQPTDNAQCFLEYGQGWHTDDGRGPAYDGDLLFPTRRTDPRVFAKREMGF